MQISGDANGRVKKLIIGTILVDKEVPIPKSVSPNAS